jgi:aromatic amino acid transport protein AroP
VTLIAVLLNYWMPQNALELLMSLVVATLVINWAMISYSHLKFRQHLDRTGQKPLFKALLYPYGNYLVLAFVVLILGIMLLIPGIQISVYAIPVWLGVMYVFYMFKGKARPLAVEPSDSVLK